MPRYKGRPSAQSIARDFPYVVEIAMPAGGLGKRLDAMHEFTPGAAFAHAMGRTDDTMNETLSVGAFPTA
jgi:hypothetical protein